MSPNRMEDLRNGLPANSASHALTEQQRAEYARRLADHRANPESAIPWDVVRAMLRERFGW